MTPHHSIRMHHQLGALTLDVACTLAAPWTVLFGPSGSGKTTILRAVAGLLRPDSAQILRESADITQLPPHLRHIRYAPQRAALFPHLTVAQNIAYGAEGASTAEVTALFALEPLAHKLPATLSGGERQRVNLARAFAATGCKLLLLDEPFTGLDRKVRDQLLPRMKQWTAERNIPTLSVTHDILEPLQLQAEVISLNDGKVTAQGPASQILAPERTLLLHQLSTP